MSTTSGWDAIRGCLRHVRSPETSARGFQDFVALRLRQAGWAVIREVGVAERGDGHRGRIDLVAERDGVRVAIELDHMSPRRKSIAKLRNYREATDRLVVLRRPCGLHWCEGIPVIGMEVMT